MTELFVEFANTVQLTKVRFAFKCKTCKHEWAVFLTPTGKLPYGGDVCSQCSKQQNLNRVETLRDVRL